MKRRLICSWSGDGEELSKTVKRLIKSQQIEWTRKHKRSQTPVRLNLQFNKLEEYENITKTNNIKPM